MVLAAALCLGVLSGASKRPALTPQIKTQVVATIGFTLDQVAFVPGADFSTWPSIAERYAKVIAKAKEAGELSLALNLALAEFGVSHLGVYPADPGRPAGPQRGFGFVVGDDAGEITVVRVLEGSKAQKLGMVPGTKLEEFWYLDYPSRERVRVSFTDANGRPHRVVFASARETWQVSASLIPVDKDTAILDVPSFNEAWYSEPKMARLARAALPYRNLVLDLRFNPGGSPAELEDLLSYFLPPNIRVGAAISKEILRDFTKDTGQPWSDHAAVVAWAPLPYAFTTRERPVRFKGKLCVLVNGGSGSCSEIAAWGLRHFAGATIVGRPTAGAVLCANSVLLPGGLELSFPWRDCWMADGTRLEKNPLQPDFWPTAAPGDPYLARALARFQN
jgi:hypothetical protein